MNLFGVGNMEMLFVLIVALLVLGPSRMVDVARQTGHWWREAQRVLREWGYEPHVAPEEPDVTD